MPTSMQTGTFTSQVHLSESFRRALRSGVIGAMAVATASCGGVTDPATEIEELAVSTFTVQSAVALLTTGPIVVPANCSGSPTINCTGGVPGGLVSLAITRTNLSVAEVSTNVYSFATDITLSSLQDIPVYYGGVNCNVGFNSANGTSPTVHVAGTATFVSRSSNGVINELDMLPAVTGVEAADFIVSGGSLCPAAPVFYNLLLGPVNQLFTDLGARLCGAPGPALFIQCPAPTQATQGRRRTS